MGSRAETSRDGRDVVRVAARLNQLYAALGEPGPVAQVVDRVLLMLSELFAADVAALLQPGPGGALHPLGAIGLPEAGGSPPFQAGDRHAAEALRTRRPVLVAEARGDPDLDPDLRALEVAAVAWLPIVGSGEPPGLLLLARCRPRPFARAEVDLLAAMAHRIGLVLERARDQEARRQLEARLQQAEKAESLGRMASAIAHHFNNKLSAVIEGLDLARAGLPPGHPVLEELDLAQDAARQAARVSGLMLTYLGHGAPPPSAIDLAATCREIWPSLAAAAPAPARLEATWPEGPLHARAHAASVRQVLANLLANALEALPAEGGLVEVRLREVDAGEVAPTPRLVPGWIPSARRYAHLEVRDTGCGVAPGDLGKVFDPFYTTKFTGRGLGLPVVLGIVRAHGGALAMESAPARGSAFSVWLPLSEAPAPVVAPAAAPHPRLRGLALVVDDEPLIRRATSRLLAELGFQVEVAVDGVEALERYRPRADEVALVVLDVTMPRMGGWETLAALRALRPGLPVVLASGYDEARVMSGDHAERPQAFLQKPFDLGELEAAVARALGRT